MTTDCNMKKTDRRTVPAREHRWSKTAARLLAQANISADAISICGVLAAFASASALAFTGSVAGFPQHFLWIFAGTMAGVRLICNMLDGMVAVEWGKSSSLGALYNEIPDRISDFVILVGAGYSFGGQAALGYIAGSMAVFTAYVRVAARSVGAPSDFGGPMAKPQRMAVVIATVAYLGFTPAGWHIAWGEAQQYGLMSLALVLISGGCIITILLRLRHAARYLRSAHEV